MANKIRLSSASFSVDASSSAIVRMVSESARGNTYKMNTVAKPALINHHWEMECLSCLTHLLSI
jgi:phage tail sheath protein FI